MPKQLHLDVAQLTDVGRKREHNEDNMAHVIPKDPQVMARKGALFIVADGMGGHAAGEVASEIAVDAVTNVYYQDDSDDVATSLLHAIKRANALIHQRAAENMLRSGMGTTCIAAVLRGNMAYIANVGDSRAYLVRGGQVRQVSQDHSWVAEQVRAGLLTEEQARNHAQRNVITRCLGTQADVDIDVFPEQLEENDALVLCSDGLSGYISDEAILKTVEQAGPQESVYHLIEQANENGGPDNITAIVVRVLEVGWEPPAMRRPAFVGGREESEDTAVLGTLPTGAASPSLVGERSGATSDFPMRLASGPLASPDSITAPQSAIAGNRGRSRLFYPTLALFVLLVVVAVGSGAYYFTHTTNGTGVDQTLQNTQTLIARANSERVTNPVQALHDLASAQNTLHTLPSNSLTSVQQQKVASLQEKLITTVQSAITSYNQLSAITLLTCSKTLSPLNTGSTGVQQAQITTVKAPNGPPVLYVLGADAQGKNGKVYQVSSNSLTPVTQIPLPTTASQVIAVTGIGQQLLLLSSSVSSSTAPQKYALSVYIPGQKKASPSVAVNAQSGFTPMVVTASVSDVYVVVTSPSSTTVFVQDYKLASGKLNSKPAVETLTAANVVSVAAFPHQQLFFLLADGSVHSLQFTPGSGAFTSVFILHAIPSPLATGTVSADTFSVRTPVPVASLVSQHGAQPLSIGAGTTSSLVVSQIGTTTHLYVMDTDAHRLLDFTEDTTTTPGPTQTTPTVSSGSAGTGGGTVGTGPGTAIVTNGNSDVTLNLVGQYISPSLFTQLKSMAAAPDGSAWYVLSQNASSMLEMIPLQTKAGSQAIC
ncbi:MAG: Stp1/IreP family PP2C-type Ser/Thr phosphatase [Ktedonobacteraceae bacterium]